MAVLSRKLLNALEESGIQFVGGVIASKAAATSGNTTLPLNSGLTGGIASAAASGDFVVAAFGTGTSSNRTLSITDGSTGYTLIGSELYAEDSGGDTSLRVAYKFITGDTTVTFGPTGDTDDAGAVAAYVFRGVNTTTPLDVSAATATAGDSGNPDPPSITPVTSGAFIVCVGATGFRGSSGSFSSSDLTDFMSVYSSNADWDVTMGIGHKPDWVSGAFNPAAFTHSPGLSVNASWAAVTLALRPA